MKSKIRVLWLAHFAPYPPKGGAMQRSFNMLKECSAFCEIDFLSLLPISKVKAYFSSFEEGKDEIKIELRKYCNKIEFIPIGKRTRKLNKLAISVRSLIEKKPYDEIALYSSEYGRLIHSYLKANSYDLVYVDTIGLMQYVKGLDIPVILNHHNIESQMLYRRSTQVSEPLSSYIRWQAAKTEHIERRFVPLVNNNFTCSKLDEDRLNAIAKCKTENIPNGVDLDYFKRKSDYDPTSVDGLIFAGGLDWYPNAAAVNFLVEKLGPVLESASISDVITVYGKGSHKKLERAHQLSSHVRKGGFVDDIRIPMERARIYLCPITDGGGTKLKVLDALAMGIPLVAHPIACEGIEVENGKHVIFAETAQEYIDAIVLLINNPQRCIEMSRAGIELIQECYSYSKIGLKIFESFSGVLKKDD